MVRIFPGSSGMPAVCGPRKVDVRLPGQVNSNSHGARPVHLIITMITWFRTRRLSIKKSLCGPRREWYSNMAHTRQSSECGAYRQSGLGFQVKVRMPSQVVPSSLGGGSVECCHLHCTAGSSRSFTAIRKDAGLCCGSRLRKGEVFAYVGSI